jgi:hypothetical protein
MQPARSSAFLLSFLMESHPHGRPFLRAAQAQLTRIAAGRFASISFTEIRAQEILRPENRFSPRQICKKKPAAMTSKGEVAAGVQRIQITRVSLRAQRLRRRLQVQQILPFV